MYTVYYLKGHESEEFKVKRELFPLLQLRTESVVHLPEVTTKHFL